MSLNAAIKALRDDAGIWADVATTTSNAARAAEGLTLTEGEMSWASRPTGLLDTYEEIRAKVSRLLGEATRNFNSLSNTLNKVATAYETSDQAALNRMKGVWDVRE
jgi:hypothetical protein